MTSPLVPEIRYALRRLALHPGFTALAVVSVGIGIGASTAMFSVLHAVLLSPLPYTKPERLVLVWSDLRSRNVKDFPFSPPDFDDLRRETTCFEALSGVSTQRMPLAVESSKPELVQVGTVTPNFFRLLGAPVAIGRDFEDKDATPEPVAAQVASPQTSDAHQDVTHRFPSTAILSYPFWQRRFGGDPHVVGRTVDLASERAQIVGVLAPGFELLFAADKQVIREPDLWTAMRIDYQKASRREVFIRAIGRLKTSTTIQQAHREVETVSAELRRRFPIKASADLHFRVEPMHEDLVRDVRPVLIALMGAVVFVFLIACANVTNLLLVRSSVRERELAIRAVLGGSSWHLVRQMLTEALLLATGGALLGIGVGLLGIKVLLALGPMDLPRLASIGISLPVLAFTVVSALAATVAFGVMPVFYVLRPNLTEALRASGRTAGLAAGSLLRKGVVMAEVALCFVLLVGSGLMLQSFLVLQRIKPGFDPQNVLTFLISGLRGPGPQRAVTVKQLRERLLALPGVRSVTAAFAIPLDGDSGLARWGTEEALVDPGKFHQASFHVVLPGYFETLRTLPLAGRTFTDPDNTPELKYVVIDSLLAAKAFPHQSAVGKRLLVRILKPEPEWLQVIGVVEHERDNSLAREGREELFVTDGYMGHGFVERWAIRSISDPLPLASVVRSHVAQLDSHLIVSDLQPMQAFVQQAQAQTRFVLLLISIFAAVAALLAAIGLYGILHVAVQQRTAEIGVRMALGAQPNRIFLLLIGEGLKLSATGIIVGLLAACGLTRMMVSMLIGVKPTDPKTLVTMVALFFLIATVASWLPARRAAAVDPTVALRKE